MEHDALDIGHLADDAREQLPAHVGFRFQLLKGARAGGAKEIAAIGDFKVKADRLALDDDRELLFRLLKVAAHRYGSGRNLGAHGITSSGQTGLLVGCL